jgi:hypothetical protein
MSASPHLRTGIDPVSETLFFFYFLEHWAMDEVNKPIVIVIVGTLQKLPSSPWVSGQWSCETVIVTTKQIPRKYTCFGSSYLAMAVLYLLAWRSFYGNGPTCHTTWYSNIQSTLHYIRKTNCLKKFKEIIIIYYENHMEHIKRTETKLKVLQS